MRVIVRLAKSKQTILRVRPDEPLIKVFDALCNKVDIANRDVVEFTHPSHPGGPLNLKCTLNDYKLRELHLTAKSKSALQQCCCYLFCCVLFAVTALLEF